MQVSNISGILVALLAYGCTADQSRVGATSASGGASSATADGSPGGPPSPDSGELVLGPSGGGIPPEVGQWGVLVEHSWKLDPGEEAYWCRRVVVQKDVWISAFRAKVPPRGMHHMTLAEDPGAIGAFPCTGVSIGSRLLYGAGVGTDEFDFPADVAVKIAAGTTILLNLHLYNTGVDPIIGTTGVEVLATDSASVKHEAFDVLAGKLAGLEVVPGASTQTGTCTMSNDVTLLSVAPHMHTHGTHQKVTARFPAFDGGADGGAPRVLLDRDYSFGDQHFDDLTPPLLLPAGGSLEIECTYENDSQKTLHFGESTNDEMCFANVYHYPSIANTSTCSR